MGIVDIEFADVNFQNDNEFQSTGIDVKIFITSIERYIFGNEMAWNG